MPSPLRSARLLTPTVLEATSRYFPPIFLSRPTLIFMPVAAAWIVPLALITLAPFTTFIVIAVGVRSSFVTVPVAAVGGTILAPTGFDRVRVGVTVATGVASAITTTLFEDEV